MNNICLDVLYIINYYRKQISYSHVYTESVYIRTNYLLFSFWYRSGKYVNVSSDMNSYNILPNLLSSISIIR